MVQPLGLEGLLVGRVGIEDESAGGPIFAAEQAEGSEALPVPVAGEGNVVNQHADVAAEAQRAARKAGPARVRNQLVAVDTHRVFQLHRLHGGVFEACQMGVLAIPPVLGGARAGPAALDVDVHEPLARLRVVAAEPAIGDLGMAAGHHPVGRCLGQRLEHGLGDLLRGVGACSDGRRQDRVDDEPRFGVDLERTVAA